MQGHLCAAAALLLLACLVGAQVTNVVVTNVSYENKILTNQGITGEKYYFSTKLSSIAISCRANSSTNITGIVWYREDGRRLDEKASSTTDLSNPLSATSTLKISHPVKADFAAYVCSATSSNTLNGTGSFNTRPLLTISVNGINEYDSSHWPGMTLTLKCSVNGYPVGYSVWTKSTNASFSYTGADLILTSISYSADRGYYTCTSVNSVGTNSATVFLRVKDSQSYIAPLVTIFCEIIIMVAFLVAYELYDKRRRQVGDGECKSE